MRVKHVIEVLERAGFERLPRPLSVAGTQFDFEASARGTSTSHDLVVVSTDEVPMRRLQRLVAGLARSLDLAGSRRPLSLVFLGEVQASERAQLERYARVLPIASNTPSYAEIEEAIGVLLPLRLPTADLLHGSDPVDEVMAALGRENVTPDHLFLIRAASEGAGAVRDKLRHYADRGVDVTDDPKDEK